MNDVADELAALGTMTTNELCARYQQLFGQPVRTRHKAYLIRKIAWRIQALAEGDLSERARKRAAELANDADVRVMPPRATTLPAMANGGKRVASASQAGDPRLPAPGNAIVRTYKGRTIRVIVREDGLEYEGQRYKTLTAVTKQVTGCHMAKHPPTGGDVIATKIEWVNLIIQTADGRAQNVYKQLELFDAGDFVQVIRERMSRVSYWNGEVERLVNLAVEKFGPRIQDMLPFRDDNPPGAAASPVS